MSYFGRIYKRNIYGVMGTLVFHILLISLFLLADVDMKGNIKEEVLIIEFPDILPVLNKPEEQIIEEEVPANPTENVAESGNNLTNLASNKTAVQNTTTSAEDFFDDEYLKEVEAAKKMVSDVNNQLSKETVDLADIKMPTQSTAGMDPDSIKNIVYVGESNIVYYLENRHHVDLAIPVYLAQGGGKVVVDIVVNQQGIVIKATPRANRRVRDEQMFLYAQTAALRTVFNSEPSAPSVQKGTIHYTFVAQ